MRFGRVEGVVSLVPTGEPALRLTVHLESGGQLQRVREETVAVLRPIRGREDLLWHADQYTQETIGVHLAAEGWEAIGTTDQPPVAEGEAARSPAYVVRNAGGPSREPCR